MGEGEGLSPHLPSCLGHRLVTGLQGPTCQGLPGGPMAELMTHRPPAVGIPQSSHSTFRCPAQAAQQPQTCRLLSSCEHRVGALSCQACRSMGLQPWSLCGVNLSQLLAAVCKPRHHDTRSTAHETRHGVKTCPRTVCIKQLCLSAKGERLSWPCTV